MQLVEREYTPNPTDGTGSWQMLPLGLETPSDNKYARGECNIVIGDTSYSVRIISDDDELTAKTIEYHETNNTFLPEYRNVSPTTLEVFYSTTHDIDLGSSVLRMGNNPYIAGISAEDGKVFATGKPSVGTLKSICFGAASSLACKNSNYVPLHASIGTFDGVHAFAISGRGNWGKTTNMIGTKIVAPELTIVTDDWSVIDVKNANIVPIDMLVAIRTEAVDGIKAAVKGTDTPSYLDTAVKDNGQLFSVIDVFGEVAMPHNLQLTKVLLTDKRVENAAITDIYDATGLNTSWRLQDDAYHSPNAFNDYHEKYSQLIGLLGIGVISTVLPNNFRATQLANIVRFFKN